MTCARPAGLGLLLALALLPGAASATPSALGGSTASMVRQHRAAEREGLAFSRTEARVAALVADGVLEPVLGNTDYVVLSSVGHKVARPEVRLLIERLAAQYRAATGDPLVVTSLVRPLDGQPANAHRLSVHPAGIAMDLRIPSRASSRQWLERTLLALEQEGVLDVTREKRPPHYHVAVFPAAYRAYVERVDAARPAAAAVVAPVVAAHGPVTVRAVALAPAAVASTAERSLLAASLVALGLGGALMAALVVIMRGRAVRAPSLEGGSATLLGVAGGA